MIAFRAALVLLLTLIASSVVAQDNMPWSRGGRVPDPSVRLDAQDLADRAGVGCLVQRAEARGTDANRAAQFEVTCADGPGYLLIDGGRPRALDCLALEAANQSSEGRTPACRIASNRNAVPIVAALAREAGIGCRVDAAAMRGRTPADGTLYEVGCAGEDGYWLERTAAGWAITACLRVQAQGGDCRFTNPDEQVASVGRWLADSPASGCEVVQVRFMGSRQTDAGEGSDLYETRCRSGAGYLARVAAAPDGPPKRLLAVYSCAEAAHIGGGCRLSNAPP